MGFRTLSDGPLGLQGGSSLLTLLNISESFFRHTLAVIGYVAEVTKNLKNDSLVKCVSNSIKWFVMMINAWDHLDSCIWGWQGGQLAPKNAEFGQNRPFLEVQGQSNDPPDNPKSYRYIYNI